MKATGIYIIRNLINKKVYIGSAVDINRRRRDHFSYLRRGNHINLHLQCAYTKYGANAFEFKILIRCEIDDLLHYEQRAIDTYREAIGWKNMYNILPTAASWLGMKHSPEAKAKMSVIHKGKVIPSDVRAKMSAVRKGRKFSSEHKAKISASNKGKEFSPEHKAKLSVAQKGKKHSSEARAKMSITRKGKKFSSEHKAKLSIAHTKRHAIARDLSL